MTFRSNRTSASAPSHVACFEPLEKRRLFSFVVFSNPSTGELRAEDLDDLGVDGNSSIRVQQDASGIYFSQNGVSQVTRYNPAVFSLITIEGGSGGDTLTVDPSLNDAADVTLLGQSGPDNLVGDANRELLVGDTGTDTLRGGLGNDVLSGGDQADQLFGGGHHDSLNGGSGNDLCNGESGNDTIDGDGGDDQLGGGDGDDELTGDIGNDSMSGNAGNDKFFAANDGGTDTIIGGTGTDTATADGTDLVTL
jgi:Ca2+-binding RTX toxin-like protein